MHNRESSLARFVKELNFDDLNEDVVNQTKCLILDTLGCIIRGSREEAPRKIASLLKRFNGERLSSVIGFGFKTDPLRASIINGSSAHALELDDVYRPAAMHPAAVVIPLRTSYKVDVLEVIAPVMLREKLNIKDGDTVMTHCNAGALATVDYGTALGVIRAAWEEGKKIKVIATETRPKLQGARLTSYELNRDGIPVTLITDNMVGYVMSKGLVDLVVVGADRIVKDAVINKIGTYTIAIVAKEHGVPFYVAAPTSTFDLKHFSGEVTIEERSADEVKGFRSERTAPEGVKALNPAFDITPMRYITAIITERGIVRPQELDSNRPK